MKLRVTHAGRIFFIRHALRAGFTIEEIFNLTKIDRWFLVQIKEIVDFEEELAERRINDELPPPGAAADLSAMKALVLKDEQFVTDANGKRVGVLLDVKTYEHLCEAEEELADIRAYDTARPKVAAELKAGQFSALADYPAKRGGKRK